MSVWLHLSFANVQVIYAGLLVTSGGADLTIWLLFVFVVLFSEIP